MDRLTHFTVRICVFSIPYPGSLVFLYPSIMHQKVIKTGYADVGFYFWGIEEHFKYFKKVREVFGFGTSVEGSLKEYVLDLLQ